MARRLARDLLVRRLRLVPPSRSVRLYALPVLPRVIEGRWHLLLRRRPVLGLDQLARTVEIGAAEELIACPLCAGRRVQPLFRPERPGRWRYHVVRCPECGLLYRNPGVRPERVPDLYQQGDYARFLAGSYAQERESDYRVAMDAFDELFADGRGRRLLDYGCGIGTFLEMARRRRFDAQGVDLSPESVQIARERGLRARVGSPQELPAIVQEGFDVVTLWSVLAHLPRPVEELAILRRLLAPGGCLLLYTVNANSLKLKSYRERWGGFTANHLVFFSPTTLQRLLAMTGFESVVFRPFYGRAVERGDARLAPRHERRLRRTVERGDQGPMLRAAAFTTRDAPRAWGLQGLDLSTPDRRPPDPSAASIAEISAAP